MLKLLNKEIKLSASKLSFLFIAFAALTMAPGYPILLGAFFISFGLFQSFQHAREANDIVYSALLPISKADVVKSKYVFCVFIELLGFLLMAALTLVRMTLLKDAAVYRENVLMNANLVFLGFALLIFGIFNSVFIGGFFKTAYYFGKPFIFFIVTAFIAVCAGEAIHHVPGLEAMNSFGFEVLPLQAAVLISGAVIYAALTILSMRASIMSFEKIDL